MNNPTPQDDDKLLYDLDYILKTRHTISIGSDKDAPYVLRLYGFIKDRDKQRERAILNGIKLLQTYKLFPSSTDKLVELDDVIDILTQPQKGNSHE